MCGCVWLLWWCVVGLCGVCVVGVGLCWLYVVCVCVYWCVVIRCDVVWFEGGVMCCVRMCCDAMWHGVCRDVCDCGEC